MFLFHLALKVMSSIQEIVTLGEKIEQETFILLRHKLGRFFLIKTKRKGEVGNFICVLRFYQNEMLINTCNFNLEGLGFLCWQLL